MASSESRNCELTERLGSVMKQTGKLVIAAMLALGILGAVGSGWYYQRLQRRPLRLWGGEAASRILRAPRVELFELVPATAATKNAQSLSVAGVPLEILMRRSVGNAPGFSHVRHSLVHDRSFDWTPSTRPAADTWAYALQFDDAGHSSLLVFSPDCRHAMLVETGTRAYLEPLAPSLLSFFEEQLSNSD